VRNSRIDDTNLQCIWRF